MVARFVRPVPVAFGWCIVLATNPEYS